MKTKEFIYKLFYVISILLMIGFCVGLGADWYTYNTTLNSAPFYIFIIARAVTFLVPALIAFIVAKVIHRKLK